MSFARRRLPSLQELVAFEAVARRSNFTKAAEELSLTQSAISKQIRQLEQTLGILLFDRGGGRVALTGAGEVYLKATKEILAHFRTAALSVGGGEEFAVNVVALPTFTAQWLIPRLPRFLAIQDRITVNLTTRVQPYDFFGASYDVAISYAAAGWTHPDATLLFEEFFLPVTSPAYWQSEGLADPANLGRATLLQQGDRPALWGHWFAVAGVTCEAPYRGPVLDRFSMTIVAASAGLGVALVPRFLVLEEIGSGNLVVVSDSVLKGEGAYHVVVPRARSRPEAVAFRRWLLREAHSDFSPDEVTQNGRRIGSSS